MTGYLLSWLVTIILSLGSLVPGAFDAQLRGTLERNLAPGRVEAIHVAGDPLLQLPFGDVPALSVDVAGARFQGLGVTRIALRLTGLKLDPLALYGAHQARLRAPVHAELEARLTEADVQAYITDLEASGRFAGLQAQVSLLGARLGGRVSLRHVQVRLLAGRVGVSGQAELGASRLPFEGSFGVALDPAGVPRLVSPALALNGRALPGLFLAAPLARLNGWLASESAWLPLKPSRVALEPGAVALGFAGTLVSLEAFGPASPRP